MILAIHSKNGFDFFNTKNYEFIKKQDESDKYKEIREILFSENGQYFYVVDKNGIFFFEFTNDFTEMPHFIECLRIPNIKNVCKSFLSNYLAICTDYTKKNVSIVDCNGKVLKELSLPEPSQWSIQFTQDERYFCSFMEDNHHCVGFYDPLNIGKALCKTPNSVNVSSFALSPRIAQTYLATFSKGTKGMPSQIRLLQYPDFVLNQFPSKNFFDGDDCQFFWNNSGQTVLALVNCQVDKTNQSYYGKQLLFLLSAKKDGMATSFNDLENPIYAISWRPTSPNKISSTSKGDAVNKTNEMSPQGNVAKSGTIKKTSKALPESFIVIYGKMPSKAILYDEQGDVLFDFGTGTRNGCYFTPQGHLLAITGSGNIHGNIEFWDMKSGKGDCKLINKLNFTKLIPTFFAWCPDGERILIATTSPRMRMENGFSIYHYTGALLYRSEEIEELYDLVWRPPYLEEYPAKEIDYNLVKSNVDETTSLMTHTFVNEKTSAYVPPHLRNKNTVNGIYVSKAKIPPPPNPKHPKRSDNNNIMKPSVIIPSAKDTIKRVRNIRKRLKQIQELKNEIKSGKTLEKTQIEKIESEEKLRDELKKLSVDDYSDN